MLRPTTLLRPLAGPLRLAGSQSMPTTNLARRRFATTPSTRSEPPSTTTSTEPSSAVTSPSASSTSTFAQGQPPKERARTFFKLRLLNKGQRTQHARQEQPAGQAAEQAPQENAHEAPVEQEQPQSQQQSGQLPYRVLRTPSNQLAVYQLAKRGGNKKLTNIKKVEGDRASFRTELAQLLGVEEKAVIVNNLTGHVIVPGHRRSEVLEWLEKQGF